MGRRISLESVAKAPHAFRAARPVLLKIAALPSEAARRTWLFADLDATEDAFAVMDYVRSLAVDPLIREALAVSSPALSAKLDRTLDGAKATPAELQRLALTLTRYVLRMSTRATPFGLLAGIAFATFGEGARIGTPLIGRRVASADMAWLMSVVADLERRPQIMAHLQLWANDLAFVRGDRLVVPYAGRAPAELSVRHTPAVRAVLSLAQTPVTSRVLVDHLLVQYPDTPRPTAEKLLCQLVRHEVLHSELHPPMDSADPMGHVLGKLASCRQDGREASHALTRIVRELKAYTAATPGNSHPAWIRVNEAMAALSPTTPRVQVDLLFPSETVLPFQVAAEAEGAAEFLWRAANDPHDPLRSYHREFLERFGVGRAIPVRALLDPDVGLGPPAGYQQPPGYRAGSSDPPNRPDMLLVDLAQSAARDRVLEIEVGPDLGKRLAPDRCDTPSFGMELCFSLFAESAAALDVGDFRLVLSRRPWLPAPGTAFGRFARLFPQNKDDLAEVAVIGAAGSCGAMPVQMEVRPIHPRAANVVAAPRWLPVTVVIGLFAERTNRRVLGVDDIHVIADERELYLLSASLEREIMPIAFHLLDWQTQAPNVARFVFEVAQRRRRAWQPWSWGAADLMPYLPRLRIGRTIISSARWRPGQALVPIATTRFAQWRSAFQVWRERWAVPDDVRLVLRDQAIDVRLDVPLHLRLLFDEIRRRPDVTLYERPAGNVFGSGWLAGHVNEIAVAFLPRRSSQPPSPSRTAPSRSVGVGHCLPGGRWLYAKLYGAEQRQDELLTRYLPPLLDACDEHVDRWFFVRYRDPGPHLRLRWCGATSRLSTIVLPALHDWAASLATAGLADRLVLDTYDPERERYGGPMSMVAAERFFTADSHATIGQLSLLMSGTLQWDRRSVVVANYVDILTAMYGADWSRWVLTSTQRSPSAPPRALRDEVIGLVTAAESSAVNGPGASSHRMWAARAAAAHHFVNVCPAAESTDAAPSTRDIAAHAFLHMHHNRLIGLDRKSEAETLALLYAVARAKQSPWNHHQDRSRMLA